MIKLTKKLLVSSALIAASLSYMAVGMDEIEQGIGRDKLQFGRVEIQTDGTRAFIPLNLSTKSTLFFEALEGIKTNGLVDQQELKNWAASVFDGNLSPQEYEARVNIPQ